MNHRTALAGLLTAGLAVTLLTAAQSAQGGQPGRSGPAGHWADDHAQRSAPRITLEVSTATPQLGQRIRLTGRVTGAEPEDRVRVQVKYHGRHRWKTLGTTRLDRNGYYRFRDEIGSERRRSYRVQTLDHRGVSTPAKVHVYGWRPVSPAPERGFFGGTVTLAGIQYPGSLRVTSSGANTNIYLGYACTKFDATYGVDDGSPPDSTATFTVYNATGGQTVGPLGLQRPVRVEVPVQGSYLSSVVVANTGGATAAIGTPRVYCETPGSLTS